MRVWYTSSQQYSSVGWQWDWNFIFVRRSTHHSCSLGTSPLPSHNPGDRKVGSAWWRIDRPSVASPRTPPTHCIAGINQEDTRPVHLNTHADKAFNVEDVVDSPHNQLVTSNLLRTTKTPVLYEQSLVFVVVGAIRRVLIVYDGKATVAAQHIRD